MLNPDKWCFGLRLEDDLEEVEQNSTQSLMLKATVGDLRDLTKTIMSLISKTITRGRM